MEIYYPLALRTLSERSFLRLGVRGRGKFLRLGVRGRGRFLGLGVRGRGRFLGLGVRGTGRFLRLGVRVALTPSQKEVLCYGTLNEIV